MNKNFIKFDNEDYLTVTTVDEERIKREEKEKVSISISLRLREKEKDTDIGLKALIELKNVGFNANYVGTLFLANIIEDLYCERVMFDASAYFDLSRFDNIHYKYVLDRYQVNDIDFYRGEIAKSIATSNCESKNINDIAYLLVDKLVKNKEKTKKLD